MGTTLRTDYDCGDLLLIPDGDGWILCMIEIDLDSWPTTYAVWGDCKRVVPEGAGQLIFRRDVPPEIGKHIGARFSSLVEAQAALRPYRKVPA